MASWHKTSFAQRLSMDELTNIYFYRAHLALLEPTHPFSEFMTPVVRFFDF